MGRADTYLALGACWHLPLLRSRTVFLQRSEALTFGFSVNFYHPPPEPYDYVTKYVSEVVRTNIFTVVVVNMLVSRFKCVSFLFFYETETQGHTCFVSWKGKKKLRYLSDLSTELVVAQVCATMFGKRFAVWTVSYLYPRVFTPREVIFLSNANQTSRK